MTISILISLANLTLTFTISIAKLDLTIKYEMIFIKRFFFNEKVCYPMHYCIG